MVTTLVLLPLLLALALSLGAAFLVLQRKSLAQAVCVQEATRLQTNLRPILRKLLAMNPEAGRLRIKRLAADRALKAAVSSGYPPAIAVAEAAEAAAIAAQTALHARQEILLAQADGLRADGQTRLRWRAARLGAWNVSARTFFPRALAVEPRPLGSLSPDYVPVMNFTRHQQQRYRFEVDLLKDWPGPRLDVEGRQASECSVSLKQGDTQWEIRILAAKASSNS